MTSKREEERLNNITERIKQLEAQKKQLEARTKEKERKERTRRLIQIGAIMDSMGISTIEIAEKFKINYQENDKAREWLNNFIKENNKINDKEV